MVELLPDSPEKVKQAKDALATAANAYDSLMAQSPPPDLEKAKTQFQDLITSKLLPAVKQAGNDAVLGELERAEAEIVGRALDTLETILSPPPPVPVDPADMLARILRGEPVAAMLNHVHLQWSPPLRAWGPTADAPIFVPELKEQAGSCCWRSTFVAVTSSIRRRRS